MWMSNSLDLVEKLKDYKADVNNDKLVFFNIVALFPSMPTDEAIIFLKNITKRRLALRWVVHCLH